MAVMMDSGIRRGTDVLKALALGANFVFVGRPVPLRRRDRRRARRASRHQALKDEIDRDMALMGMNSLAEMTPERLKPARGRGLPEQGLGIRRQGSGARVSRSTAPGRQRRYTTASPSLSRAR